MNVLRFILSAIYMRCAYIDLDGCLLQRFRCPPDIRKYGPNVVLEWWTANLKPTPIVIRRLILLYILRACGVDLYIWTNRSPQHERVTRQALGRHMWLFSSWFYLSGGKDKFRLWGPCMDDQEKYLRCGIGHSLLVEQV